MVSCVTALCWPSLVVFFCVLLVPNMARAETVWQRVGKKSVQADELLIVSTEKVLWGQGDELDMFRARTALVALSRGEIVDPRAIVLLHRLRRELRLNPGRNAIELLQRALTGRLSATYHAWAWMELSHVSASQGAPARALLELESAQKVAWRADDRAAIDVFSGWLLLAEHRTTEARERLSRLTNQAAPQRLLTQARVGLSLVAAQSGDAALTTALAMQAFSLQAGRASVSGVDLFWELQLDESMRIAAELVLSWGKAKHAEMMGDDEVAERETRLVCDQLAGENEWTQLLSEMWRQSCEPSEGSSGLEKPNGLESRR